MDAITSSMHEKMQQPYIDPAILSCVPPRFYKPHKRYSREQLLSLRKAKLSIRRPNYINPSIMRVSSSIQEIYPRPRNGISAAIVSGDKCLLPSFACRPEDPKDLCNETILFPQGKSIKTGPTPAASRWDADRNTTERNNRRFICGGPTGNPLIDHDDSHHVEYQQNYRYKWSMGNNRFFNKNDQRYEGKSKEPEWFSEGPTSRHDTIDLHGFDDDERLDDQQPPDDITTLQPIRQDREITKSNKHKTNINNNIIAVDNLSGEIELNASTGMDSKNNEPSAYSTPTKFNNGAVAREVQSQMSNDYNENGDKKRAAIEAENANESFFNRFYRQISPTNAVDDKRNITSGQEFFQRVNASDQLKPNLPAQLWNNPVSGNIPLSGPQFQSVEELEARMRQCNVRSNSEENNGNAQRSQQDKDAFKNLFSQKSPQHIGNRMPILNMGQQQIPEQRYQENVQNVHPQQQQQPPPLIAADLVPMELRSEVNFFLNAFALNRMTIPKLVQITNNTTIDQRHREVASATLQVLQMNLIMQAQSHTLHGFSNIPPQTIDTAPMQLAAPPGYQNSMHHSSNASNFYQPHGTIIPNANTQRMPSTLELQHHTQTIMQSALNRKRQEQQFNNNTAAMLSPPSMRPSHLQSTTLPPKPFSFTPTAVMIKMAQGNTAVNTGVTDNLGEGVHSINNRFESPNKSPRQEAAMRENFATWNTGPSLTPTERPIGRAIIKTPNQVPFNAGHNGLQPHQMHELQQHSVTHDALQFNLHVQQQLMKSAGQIGQSLQY